jgi:hypothetical protein
MMAIARHTTKPSTTIDYKELVLAMPRRLWTWSLTPTGVIFWIGLAIALFKLLCSYLNPDVPYTSDAVIWQNALLSWKPFHHQLYYADGGASYIAKVPIYWLVSLVLSPGPHAMLAGAVVLVIMNYLLVFYAIIYFMRQMGIMQSYKTLLPLLWLSSFGIALVQYFMGDSLHNVEIGFILLLFVIAHKAYAGAFDRLSLLKQSIIFVLTGMLGGLMIVDDHYFLSFGIGPVALALLLGLLIRLPKWRRLLLLLVTTGWIYICSDIVEKIATKSGMFFIKNGVSGTALPNIVPYSSLYTSIANTAHSILIMFGADFFGEPIAVFASLVAGVNAIIVLVIFFTLKLPWQQDDTKKRETLRFEPQFISAVFIFCLLTYTLTTVSDLTTNTYYYLLILPYLAMFLLIMLGARLPRIGNVLLNILLIVGTVLNIGSGLISLKDSSHIADIYTNNRNYSLISYLQKHHLTKGYAPYGDANIDSYLSKGSIDMFPYACAGTNLIPFKWLFNDSLQAKPANNSFILVDTAYPQAGSCTENALIQQLGSPQQVLQLPPYTIYAYNHDVSPTIVKDGQGFAPPY